MLVGRGARIKNKLFWGVVDQKRLRTTDLYYNGFRDFFVATRRTSY